VKVLLISSHGNPRNEKLWSGTPANLFRNLEATNVVQIESMFTLKYKTIDLILLFFEVICKFERRRSALRRLITTRILWIRLHRKKDNFTHLLFFDIEGDPKVLASKPNGPKFYRLLDSTEVQWEKVNNRFVSSKADEFKKQKAKEFEILNNFDGFFVLTEATRDSLVKDYQISSQRIRVVRTGLGQPVDSSSTSVPKLLSDSTNLLTIAKGEHWRKGIDLLLDVFRLNLVDKSIELTAILGDNFADVIPRGVEKFGFMSLQDLNRKFQTAEIFILPCRFEPYGLVFIEAVRMGLPIVTTKYSGLGYEFIKSGWPGKIVEPEANSIARGIIEVRNLEISTLGDLPRMQSEILKSFSWPRMAHDILQEWKLIEK